MLEELLDLCEYQYNISDYENLIKTCDTVMEIDSDNPAAQNYKAISLYYLRDYDRSLDLLNQALKMHPSNRYTLNNMALVYIALKQYEKALKCCEEGLKSGDFDWLFINKIESLIHLDRIDEAYEFYRSVNIPYYTFNEALDNCGKSQSGLKSQYEKLGELFDDRRYAEVLKLCDEMEISEKLYDYRIISLIHLKRYDEAMECVNEAIELYPYNYNFHFIKARISVICHDFDEAIENYEKAFEISGLSNNRLEINDYINCLNIRITSHIQSGNYCEAERDLKKVLKIREEKR